VLGQIFTNIDWADMSQAVVDTLYMLSVSVFFSTVIGIPMGIVLYLTDKGMLLQNKVVYSILSFIVNV